MSKVRKVHLSNHKKTKRQWEQEQNLEEERKGSELDTVGNSTLLLGVESVSSVSNIIFDLFRREYGDSGDSVPWITPKKTDSYYKCHGVLIITLSICVADGEIDTLDGMGIVNGDIILQKEKHDTEEDKVTCSSFDIVYDEVKKGKIVYCSDERILYYKPSLSQHAYMWMPSLGEIINKIEKRISKEPIKDERYGMVYRVDYDGEIKYQDIDMMIGDYLLVANELGILVLDTRARDDLIAHLLTSKRSLVQEVVYVPNVHEIVDYFNKNHIQMIGGIPLYTDFDFINIQDEGLLNGISKVLRGGEGSILNFMHSLGLKIMERLPREYILVESITLLKPTRIVKERGGVSGEDKGVLLRDTNCALNIKWWTDRTAIITDEIYLSEIIKSGAFNLDDFYHSILPDLDIIRNAPDSAIALCQLKEQASELLVVALNNYRPRVAVTTSPFIPYLLGYQVSQTILFSDNKMISVSLRDIWGIPKRKRPSASIKFIKEKITSYTKGSQTVAAIRKWFRTIPALPTSLTDYLLNRMGSAPRYKRLDDVILALANESGEGGSEGIPAPGSTTDH